MKKINKSKNIHHDSWKTKRRWEGSLSYNYLNEKANVAQDSNVKVGDINQLKICEYLGREIKEQVTYRVAKQVYRWMTKEGEANQQKVKHTILENIPVITHITNSLSNTELAQIKQQWKYIYASSYSIEFEPSEQIQVVQDNDVQYRFPWYFGYSPPNSLLRNPITTAEMKELVNWESGKWTTYKDFEHKLASRRFKIFQSQKQPPKWINTKFLSRWSVTNFRIRQPGVDDQINRFNVVDQHDGAGVKNQVDAGCKIEIPKNVQQNVLYQNQQSDPQPYEYEEIGNYSIIDRIQQQQLNAFGKLHFYCQDTAYKGLMPGTFIVKVQYYLAGEIERRQYPMWIDDCVFFDNFSQPITTTIIFRLLIEFKNAIEQLKNILDPGQEQNYVALNERLDQIVNIIKITDQNWHLITQDIRDGQQGRNAERYLNPMNLDQIRELGINQYMSRVRRSNRNLPMQ